MLYDKRWELETPPFAPLEPWRLVMLQAAEVIERCGWCQGHYHRRGGHCAIGAISTAARNMPATSLASLRGNQAATKAHRMLKLAVGPVGQWNDHPERTAAEVVAKMREVARS